MEVFLEISGPLTPAVFDFGNCLGICFDWEHGVLHLLAIGLLLQDTWHADVWRHMVNHARKSACNYVRKNRTKYLGGPGNRTRLCSNGPELHN